MDTLPNPLTPLAWLPPDVATQLEASRYLYSATIGAWIWDYLMSIPEEYQLLTRYRLTLSDLVYAFARIASCGFITTSLVFQVAPVSNCHVLAKTIGWFGAFALPLNSLLFFFRVRAVFNQNRIIVAFFAFLWLATWVSITAPFGVDGTHIGTTMNCVNTNVKPFSSAGIVIVAVNDTTVFIAITARLLMYSLADTWSARFRAFFSGRGMGKMSRAILQTGQMYYLITVGMNVVAMSVILSPSVPPVFRAMFSIPNVALQNAMACRVYRLLKLGLIKEGPAVFSHGSSNPIRFVSGSGRSEYSTGQTQASTDVESMVLTTPSFRAQKGGRPAVMHVDINQETEISVDPADHTLRSKMDWKRGDMEFA